MKQEATKIDALRRAFQDPSPDPPQSSSSLPQGPCPDPDTLWEAANGGLALLDRYRVVDHLTQCAECTLAWRLAMDLSEEDTAYGKRAAVVSMPTTVSIRPPRPSAWRRAVVPLVSAAAAVVLAVGLMFFHDGGRQDAPVVTRGTAPVAAMELESPVDDQAVPRDEFVLTWTPGPAGTTYDVKVLTDTWETLAVAVDLESNSFEIPEDLLADLAPGSELIWEVNAELPSGAGSQTGTFSSTIE